MVAAAAQNLPSIHIEYRENGSLIGAYGNVLIGLSSGRAGYQGLEASRRVHERLRAAYPDGFLKLVISPQGAQMPSSEERKQIDGLVRDYASHTLAIALVFEGNGIWLSSMRMVSRAMMLAMSRDFPQQIFGTAEEAVPWMRKQAGTAACFDEAGLLASLAAER